MNQLRVLIVDDSLTIRAMVESLLSGERGFRVVGLASDVATARQMMADLVPDLVLLDLNLPDVSGMQMLQDLHGRPHAPIVVVSSATSEGAEASEKAIELGAKACFDKGKVICDAQRFLRLLKKVAKREAATAA